jgi:bifunctional ADP-heptose synthase (sugar kinase/adenylyltransferase)
LASFGTVSDIIPYIYGEKLGNFRVMLDRPNKVVLAHGCWDLLHLGHIQHLQAAAEMGDTLIVSVTAD